MDRFRGSWPDSSAPGEGGGFSRFAVGRDTNSTQDDRAQASARRRQSNTDGLDAPGRRAGGGMASFTLGARSAHGTPRSQGAPGGVHGSSISTPVQQQQQQGFSLFGGKAYSTPTSGGQRPPLASSGGNGRSPVDTHGTGLPRFKTLAQQTQEEEEEDLERLRRRRGTAVGARAFLPESDPSPASVMGTPLPARPPKEPPSRGNSPFGQASFTTTPSPAVTPSAAGAVKIAGTPAAASGRKRPRAPPSIGTPSGAKHSTPVVRAPAATAAGGSPRNARREPPTAAAATTKKPQARQHERVWGGVESRGAGGQPQTQRSPRPPAAQGNTGGKPRARSPRPGNKSPSSQSPRGRSGSWQLSNQPPPPPRRYTLADFAGADEACFNPGESGAVLFSSFSCHELCNVAPPFPGVCVHSFLVRVTLCPIQGG